MKIVAFFLAALFGFSGLFILFRTIKDSQRIYFGTESSKAYILKNAFFTGLASSLLFFALFFIGSIIENDFSWSFQGIFTFQIFATLVGLVVFLGTLLHFFITGVYRGVAIKKIIEIIRQDKQN